MPSVTARALAACGPLASGIWLAGCDIIVGFGDLPPRAEVPVSEQCFADGPQRVEAKAELTLRVPFTQNGGVAVTEPLRVEACQVFDPACASPLAAAITDASGVAELVVPTSQPVGDFLGFFRIGQPGYFRSSTFFRPPPRVDLTLPATIAVTDQIVTLLTDVLGIAPETLDERAHLAILPVTCARAPVAGIEPVLPTDAGLVDQTTLTLVRSAGNLLPGARETSEDGLIVFLNLRLPDGQNGLPITLSLIDRTTQTEFVPPQLVPLRRGELTTLVVAPAP